MIEKEYTYQVGKEKKIERLIMDDHVNINHMILPKGERLPEHFSNANVYMIVISGTVSLILNDQEQHTYAKGAILNIPNKTKMNVLNNDEQVVELFVVKAPAPIN